MTRKVVVITSTRADYGLLRWLIYELKRTAGIAVEILATGTHFLNEFGETWKAIEADGFTINHRVEIFTDSDTPLGVAQATGKALTEIAKVLDATRPDITLVLGDRFEILAAAEASFLLGIPVAHIAGGEVTEGALDDSIRHAITKLSTLHFVSSEEYRRRVAQLGENPEHIFDVGAPGLDNFERLKLLEQSELSDFLGFSVGMRPMAVCTFHPETTSDMPVEEFLEPALDAMATLDEWDFVVTMSNGDSGGRRINALLTSFAESHTKNIHLFPSLGQVGYLSAITFADAVVGNSSSGIVEAPTAGTPTVNIGSRQAGRLRAASVIDVENDTTSILNAIELCRNEEMKQIASKKKSPFGSAGSAAETARILATTNLSELLPKRFSDLK